MGSLSERPFEATQATASAFNSTTRVSPEAAHQIDLDGDEERAEIAEQETRPSEKEKKKKKKRKDKP